MEHKIMTFDESFEMSSIYTVHTGLYFISNRLQDYPEVTESDKGLAITVVFYQVSKRDFTSEQRKKVLYGREKHRNRRNKRAE